MMIPTHPWTYTFIKDNLDEETRALWTFDSYTDKLQPFLSQSKHQMTFRYDQLISFFEKLILYPPVSLEAALNEVDYWERKGVYCVFISIVAQHLEPSLKYVQGYSSIQTLDAFVASIFGEEQNGIHAWVVSEQYVLDFTAIQHEHSVERVRPDSFYIAELPNNIRYYGQIETKDTINYWTELFAEQAFMSKDEWVTYWQRLYAKHTEKKVVLD